LEVSTNNNDIKRAATTGTVWVTMLRFSTFPLRLLSTILLTRWLAPEVFGIAVFLSSVTTGVAMFMDLGLNDCVIRSENYKDERFLHTAWTLQFFRGIVIWLVGSLLSVPLAAMYGHPELAELIVYSLFIVVLSGFASGRDRIYKRNLDLRPIAYVEFLFLVGQILATIGFVFYLRSVWGIIFGSYVAVMVRVFFSYALLKGLWPRFMMDRQHIPELLTFGKWALLSSPVTYLVNQFFVIVFPVYFSFAVVGLFSLAYKFIEIVNSLLNSVLSQVLFPLFVRARDIKDSVSTKRAVTYYKILCTLPVCAFGSILIVISRDLIMFLYDARYHSSADMIAPLAIFMMLQAIGWQHLFSLLKAEGYVRFTVYFRVLYLLLMLTPALYGGAEGSVFIVLWGCAGVGFVLFFVGQALSARFDALTRRLDLILLSFSFGSTWLSHLFFPLWLTEHSLFFKICAKSAIMGGAWLLLAGMLIRLFDLNMTFITEKLPWRKRQAEVAS